LHNASVYVICDIGYTMITIYIVISYLLHTITISITNYYYFYYTVIAFFYTQFNITAFSVPKDSI